MVRIESIEQKCKWHIQVRQPERKEDNALLQEILESVRAKFDLSPTVVILSEDLDEKVRTHIDNLLA